MSDFDVTVKDTDPVVPETKVDVDPVVEVKVEAPKPEAPKPEAPKPEAPKIEAKPVNNKTVVLYALKDLTIPGTGSLTKGYNTVSANVADKWLEKASVRLANAEEIKTYHNK